MTIVIKYGGAAHTQMKQILKKITKLKASGKQIVVVHGGGPAISEMCQKLGILPQFAQGLRVTDSATLEIAQMVLMGKINLEIVSHLDQAVGLSGFDGNLLATKKMDGDLGLVGVIEKVNPAILHTLLNAGYIPVIAPITNHNINADTAAAAIAIALQAEELLFLSDIPGILANPQDPSSLIPEITSDHIQKLIASGCIQKGMIPKIKAAESALGHVGKIQINGTTLI